jgi:hypothetical protein
MGEFKVLPQHFLGGTEEYHKKPHSGWLVSLPRLRQATSQIQVGSIIALTNFLTELLKELLLSGHPMSVVHRSLRGVQDISGSILKRCIMVDILCLYYYKTKKIISIVPVIICIVLFFCSKLHFHG